MAIAKIEPPIIITMKPGRKSLPSDFAERNAPIPKPAMTVPRATGETAQRSEESRSEGRTMTAAIPWRRARLQPAAIASSVSSGANKGNSKIFDRSARVLGTFVEGSNLHCRRKERGGKTGGLRPNGAGGGP